MAVLSRPAVTRLTLLLLSPFGLHPLVGIVVRRFVACLHSAVDKRRNSNSNSKTSRRHCISSITKTSTPCKYKMPNSFRLSNSWVTKSPSKRRGITAPTLPDYLVVNEKPLSRVIVILSSQPTIVVCFLRGRMHACSRSTRRLQTVSPLPYSTLLFMAGNEFVLFHDVAR